MSVVDLGHGFVQIYVFDRRGKDIRDGDHLEFIQHLFGGKIDGV